MYFFYNYGYNNILKNYILQLNIILLGINMEKFKEIGSVVFPVSSDKLKII